MTACNQKIKVKKATSLVPTPSDIQAVRKAAGLSQTAAAALIYSGLRTWQQWESGDRKMHAGLWELFVIKIESHQ